MPVEPAIAFRAGQPVLACSSIGVGLHPATVLGLHRVLALGQPLAAAVGAPLVHGHDIVMGDSGTSIPAHRELTTPSHVLDERFPQACLDAVRSAGHCVSARSADDPMLPRGFWAAITTDPDARVLTAARTPYGQSPVRTIR
jgi:gamma-glutamyltranspeptidase/glutathione hydrolase